MLNTYYITTLGTYYICRAGKRLWMSDPLNTSPGRHRGDGPTHPQTYKYLLVQSYEPCNKKTTFVDLWPSRASVSNSFTQEWGLTGGYAMCAVMRQYCVTAFNVLLFSDQCPWSPNTCCLNILMNCGNVYCVKILLN